MTRLPEVTDLPIPYRVQLQERMIFRRAAIDDEKTSRGPLSSFSLTLHFPIVPGLTPVVNMQAACNLICGLF